MEGILMVVHGLVSDTQVDPASRYFNAVIVLVRYPYVLIVAVVEDYVVSIVSPTDYATSVLCNLLPKTLDEVSILLLERFLDDCNGSVLEHIFLHYIL